MDLENGNQSGSSLKIKRNMMKKWISQMILLLIIVFSGASIKSYSVVRPCHTTSERMRNLSWLSKLRKEVVELLNVNLWLIKIPIKRCFLTTTKKQKNQNHFKKLMKVMHIWTLHGQATNNWSLHFMVWVKLNGILNEWYIRNFCINLNIY